MDPQILEFPSPNFDIEEIDIEEQIDELLVGDDEERISGFLYSVAKALIAEIEISDLVKALLEKYTIEIWSFQHQESTIQMILEEADENTFIKLINTRTFAGI